jgi:4'-phosphopantetheinyl transferase
VQLAADLRRSNRADVWWVNPHDLAPSTVDARLDDNDREALGRRVDLGGQAAARRCGRALLRLVAAEMLACDPADVVIVRECPRCGISDHGRPAVVGLRCGFSTAVTESVAVVATGTAAIGIDVGSGKEADHASSSAAAVLTPVALEELDHMPIELRDEAALAAIAQLEAYAKSAGLALSAVAGKVPVSLDPCRPRIGGQCGSLLAIRVDPDPDHVAVLVVDPPPAAVQVRRAGALFA